ncbi:hypothetical protein AB4Y96_22980 [Phyllobacterium sp. TAF24]|uniref:hypothetical protein n=1 Tax=Phyllobacterium sp. TAF24 TaxID=3233068 RepID=UPI003F9545DE
MRGLDLDTLIGAMGKVMAENADILAQTHLRHGGAGNQQADAKYTNKNARQRARA